MILKVMEQKLSEREKRVVLQWRRKRNRCWFRAHFLIRSFEIKISFLLEAHWNLLLVDTSFSIVMRYWLLGSETHLVCHWWMMLRSTAPFTSLIDAGIQRSICSMVVADFANASAFSLPGIPTWSGTQTSVTFLPRSCISEIMVRVLLIFWSKWLQSFSASRVAQNDYIEGFPLLGVLHVNQTVFHGC